MPAALLPILIGTGIAAGGQVAGAVISSKAAGKAAMVQKTAEERSLALQRQMYQDAQARYQPYQDYGTAALPTLRALAGNVQAPRYGTNLADLSIYGSSRPIAPQSQSGAGMAGPEIGGMVQMRAPNGSMKAVRRELVQHYLQRGAEVVNA